MSAQSMINAALDQGVGPVCMRPGMGTSARTAPVPASAPTSVVITNAPSEYAPSDGMTSCQFRFNPLRGRGTCATVGTPTVAVHVLRESLPVAPAGTHLCAFHSPFDVVTAPVSALCPDVLTGCAHTMVMNEDGVGVACKEWSDAHGIEWRQAPARGVSLAKATDRDVPGVVAYVTSEWELDYRRSVRGADVDRAVQVGPIGVGPALERNDLRALSCALRVMAMAGGVR